MQPPQQRPGDEADREQSLQAEALCAAPALLPAPAYELLCLHLLMNFAALFLPALFNALRLMSLQSQSLDSDD